MTQKHKHFKGRTAKHYITPTAHCGLDVVVGGAVGVVSVGMEEENGSSSSENRPFDCEVGGAGGGASEEVDLEKENNSNSST